MRIRKKNLILSILILSIVIISLASYFLRNSNLNSSISVTGKVISEAASSAYNSIARIIGLTVDETITGSESGESAEQLMEGTEKEQESEQAEELIEEQTTEKPKEQTGEETGREIGEAGEDGLVGVEEQPEQEITEETQEKTTEEATNETEEQAEEDIIIENITEEQEINITIPEATNLTRENLTEINVTIPEANLTNITETNITIPEINVTIPEANLTNITETNITIPEINLTTENITEINKTIINETFVNETLMTENITVFNVTTKQYKAVINRPVKWIKTLKINKTEAGNLTLEIPKQAENITVKTGKEVQEALKEEEEYEKVIDKTKRNNLITGEVTGYADLDIENSRGILTRFWKWLTSLTITGKVIQENELQEEITEKQDAKEIDLTSIIEQVEEQDEIAVEYYTQAPTAEESNITRGKQVIVSGPDELNYTEVLAYTILDNKISINNSDKIKLYWMKEEAEKIPEAQEEIIEEATETHEETAKGGAEQEIIEKTQEKIREEEQTTKEEIIDETTEETTNETGGQAIAEEATTNETTKPAAEKIREETTEETQEKTTEEATTNEENITEQASTITAFAIDESLELEKIEKKAEKPESKAQKIAARAIREEVNFTVYDLDEDGNIDYIEWTVSHLSEQIYEIIYISKAEHLDENYSFIEDVYEEVREKDDNWTLIPDREYLRVTFEKPLDKTKDITIYARVKDDCVSENNSVMINGTEVPCSIYQKKKRIDEIRRILGNKRE